MERYAQRTPDRNGQHIDTVAVGVPVSVLNLYRQPNVENHYCSCRPVGTVAVPVVPQYESEGRRIYQPATARHQGRGGTMARPFPIMADTPSERWRENNPSGTPRHLTRKQSNVRNF